jgi:hypothetical protein
LLILITSVPPGCPDHLPEVEGADGHDQVQHAQRQVARTGDRVLLPRGRPLRQTHVRILGRLYGLI